MKLTDVPITIIIITPDHQWNVHTERISICSCSCISIGVNDETLMYTVGPVAAVVAIGVVGGSINISMSIINRSIELMTDQKNNRSLSI